MDSKRDLLLLTPDFPPNRGGVARYLSALATYLKERIVVVAEEHPEWQQTDPLAPYPVYRTPLLYKHWWPKWMKTTRYLKQVRAQYNIVLVSHVLPYGTAAMAANIPYIIFTHGLDIRLAKRNAHKRKVAERVLKKARLVVANSEALAQEILQDFNVQSLVIHPCLDVQELQVKKASPRLELLTVSRLVERKGHSFVLNTLAALRHGGALQDFTYHIVGTGPMKMTLESMTHELGLDGHVQFHGGVSDDELQRFYAQADIFVMPVTDDPIDKEGFGYVFLEAAAHATPSITTRIPGVDEAVIDGETGLLIDAGDQKQLAHAITQLATDEDYRAALGQRAYARVKSTFDCKQQFSKLDPYL